MCLPSTTKSMFLLVIILVCVASGAFGQTTWYIDDDTCPKPGSGTQADPFCRIQDGIDASSSGDELVAAPGLYIENINFLGKVITLRSEGPDAAPGTVIDGSNPENPESASTVRFSSGESSSAVLDGFTITGGSGTATPFDSSNDLLGGGILCIFNSSPTIRNCIITDNVIADGYGGGFYGKASNAEFHDCTFTSNTAPIGGGLYAENGLLTMSGCTIRDNGAYGIRCDDLNMSNCLIESNANAGIYAGNATLTNCQILQNWGPGILCYTSTLSNCLIANNFNSGLSSNSAGGIACWSNSPSTITNCTITGNFSHWVGGIRCTNATIKDCTITGNHAETNAGGIHLNDDSEAVI
ncbi:MAG: right-handed parallel beta-helix repeat-containing protein [Planctomycetes bacterium]|nr:right-handed parallel beta-helix repeat-containing protein [Planctomycetota bacterium]